MVRLPRPRLTLSAVPLWGGGAAAVLAAAFFVVLPDWRLEALIDETGIANLLPMAAPPLGNTARLLLAVIAAAVAGAVAWSVLFLLFGPGGAFHRATAGDRPIVRRADAHPDAPPRHPMTAAELGVPPPPADAPAAPPAERPIPADLDQPLAAFDPAAIPEVPLAPSPAVASLAEIRPPARPIADAAPDVETPPAPPPVPAPAPLPRNDAPPPSIAALLDRLERGARRRR